MSWSCRWIKMEIAACEVQLDIDLTFKQIQHSEHAISFMTLLWIVTKSWILLFVATYREIHPKPFIDTTQNKHKFYDVGLLFFQRSWKWKMDPMETKLILQGPTSASMNMGGRVDSNSNTWLFHSICLNTLRLFRSIANFFSWDKLSRVNSKIKTTIWQHAWYSTNLELSK